MASVTVSYFYLKVRDRMDAAEEEIEKLKKAGVGGSSVCKKIFIPNSRRRPRETCAIDQGASRHES